MKAEKPENKGLNKCRNTLGKHTKLRHKGLVEGVFETGAAHSAYVYPLRAKWRVFTAGEVKKIFRNGLPDKCGPVQFLITIPKRKMRHAVDRVLLRRRVRESYRLLRRDFEARLSLPDGAILGIAFLWVGDKKEPFDFISERMESLLEKILKGLRSVVSNGICES